MQTADKTMLIETILITKNSKNKLTFTLPTGMTGIQFKLFLEKYKKQIKQFKL